MRLTLIHPAIGRHAGDTRYIRSWQMEPLAPALLAGLTPDDVSVSFWDDRLESIPYDEPTDLVALSVETYTARRAYQIASEYRRRGVPVVLGGFHATLCPDEVGRYAEALVVGEAEGVWAQVIDDARHGRLERRYQSPERPPLAGATPDRSIFRGKRYLPVRLIEAGRGCHFRCDFCAIQAYFGSTQRRRPVGDIIDEVERNRPRTNFFFFVDDNITSNMEEAKELYRALARLEIRWVSQASITAARDEEFLDLIARSGCQGLLVGFESLDPGTLRSMNKAWNALDGGYGRELAALRRRGIRLYGTFVFGYDGETHEAFDRAVDFAREHRFYIAAFNHLTPFPGTPLYRRLAEEGRLRYDAWWLDPSYRYNQIPFRPDRLTPEELQQACIDARRKFYSWSSIARRGVDPVNRGDWFMLRNFFPINAMIRREVQQRDSLPLGDAGYAGPLLPVDAAPVGAGGPA